MARNNFDGIFFFVLSLIYCAFALVLPIVDLAYAGKTNMVFCEPIKYINNTNVSEGTFPPGDTRLGSSIGIKTWLIVHGAIGVFETVYVVFLFSTVILANNSFNSNNDPDNYIIAYCGSMCFFVLMILFRFSWLIVGAVMFWRGCYNTGPKINLFTFLYSLQCMNNAYIFAYRFFKLF